MELDFSRLFGSEPTEAPQKGEPGAEFPELQREADTAAGKLAQAKAVYRIYQQNTRKVEAMQADILKALNLGENICSIFLQAAEAVALLTNNPAFYTSCKEKLFDIYGVGLGEPGSLELAADEVEGRLKKLIEAAKRETDPAVKSRINTAVREHKQWLDAHK